MVHLKDHVPSNQQKDDVYKIRLWDDECWSDPSDSQEHVQAAPILMNWPWAECTMEKSVPICLLRYCLLSFTYYYSLVKESPWVVHLTSLPKRGINALSQYYGQHHVTVSAQCMLC